MIITPHTSMMEFMDDYDAFIVDLWGVIHDGNELYPEVHDSLKQLKKRHKKIVFLSNAPRRSQKAKEVLDRLGIETTDYDTIITSGEILFQNLQKTLPVKNEKFVIIGPDRDDDLLDGLSAYQRIDEMSEAQFVIVTGFDEDNSTIEDVLPELHIALSHKLPMICANPDMVVVRRDKTRALCAGVIAKIYEEMGGKVVSFGKPYPDVYRACLDYLSPIPVTRIAAIGDNLETDIQGANQQQIDSFLIAGGILAEELQIEHGKLPSLPALNNICKQLNIYPKGVLPAFIF